MSLQKKNFNKMDLEERCRFFYKKGVPSHAKNYFELYYRGFVVIHILNKQFRRI